METVLIVVGLVVVFVVVVALVLRFGPGRAGGRSGPGLKRRFGPEYERTLTRHGGDTEAAERELAERVERHGGLRPVPLAPELREQYVAKWTGLQESFVDAPQQAVTEAERLLALLAQDRGFPAATAYDEQVAALSVHHAHHVDGYRVLHRSARADGTTAPNTEELRSAMVEARKLFEELVAEHPEESRPGATGPTGRGGHRPRALRPKGSGV
ncbi:hypothetical protein NX801_27075 [Streptomyces sp. LP05-1]|uniref:Secreted protein n=1 Tax=Streptomyces pyxinae TaxID=2970734 RepID=A0ABT2CP86_9ACTN|nr:hypothetical protein [Streptomyces sp. LP05-1]MCS0639239.1 hypothetical protein [Streptomyces sp. LP05-1]